MACNSRPAGGAAAAIALVVLAVFARPVGHFFGTAALMVAIAVATAGAAIAAAFALAGFLTARHARAARGPVSTAERSQAAPRWPDRPMLRAESASRPAPGPAGRTGQKERVGSTALLFAWPPAIYPVRPSRCPRKALRHGYPLGQHRHQLRGAKVVRRHDDPEDDYVVMTDPEGNEFCVCAVADL
jgi:hypothetical protein